jgi:hypothetical protein
MKNVVIIPCFKRPEYLAIMLKYIELSDLACEQKYLFAYDFGADTDNLKVIDEFPFEKIITKRAPRYGLTKQSANILMAYKEACQMTDGKIFLIEDDIFIGKDFFKWHLQIHDDNPDIFCSIASRNHRQSFDTTNNYDEYYKGGLSDYQSWGVCWTKKVLIEFVINHFNRNYLFSPVSYCKSIAIKESVVGSGYVEQDGLIRRIKERCGLDSIFPHVPRCYHAGVYSYNRNLKRKLTGSLTDKINQLINILSVPELYKSWCENEDFYKDSMPVDLTIDCKTKYKLYGGK